MQLNDDKMFGLNFKARFTLYMLISGIVLLVASSIVRNASRPVDKYCLVQRGNFYGINERRIIGPDAHVDGVDTQFKAEAVEYLKALNEVDRPWVRCSTNLP